MIRSVLLKHKIEETSAATYSLKTFFKKTLPAASPGDFGWPTVVLSDKASLHNGIWQIKIVSIHAVLQADVSHICQITSPWVQRDQHTTQGFKREECCLGLISMRGEAGETIDWKNPLTEYFDVTNIDEILSVKLSSVDSNEGTFERLSELYIWAVYKRRQ
jgi:hypothetical protein